MAMETAVALASNFKLLLVGRILVAVEKMVHVMIGIKHDCVCIDGVKLPRVLSRRGAIMFDPLNNTYPNHVYVLSP